MVFENFIALNVPFKVYIHFTKTFKIGTIVDETSTETYRIVPINKINSTNNASSNQKFNHASNVHLISKRDTDEKDSQKFDLKTDDYIEIIGGKFRKMQYNKL